MSSAPSAGAGTVANTATGRPLHAPLTHQQISTRVTTVGSNVVGSALALPSGEIHERGRGAGVVDRDARPGVRVEPSGPTTRSEQDSPTNAIKAVAARRTLVRVMRMGQAPVVMSASVVRPDRRRTRASPIPQSPVSTSANVTG